jgi:hypothetical protein
LFLELTFGKCTAEKFKLTALIFSKLVKKSILIL